MKKTLYERLGGDAGVRKLANDIADNHLKNPLIKTRFEAIEDLDKVKQIVYEFIGAGTGGPQTYTGKGMLGAHKGMNISEQEFIAVVDDIMLAMDQNDLGKEEKKDMLAIGYSLKDEIIRV
ncbi:truncated hemoglobin [Sulfurovum sp.]|uniref:truncated hemoglobin n=1 Tax=Sulfurovum sp. TaxID=1969726 RepID=UPI0025DFEC57|nr:group 1 truncated hemoglobin [Sulfurovum sp.]